MRSVYGVEPGDVPRPPDNVGPDITNLNVPGSLPYIQIRMTFFLSDSMGLDDPGAFVDAWRIRFEEDL